MNKKEFRNQVYKLRNEGFTIKYEKDLSFRNPVINYSFDIGSGYTFVTDISCEKYSSDDIYTGTGHSLTAKADVNNGVKKILKILDSRIGKYKFDSSKTPTLKS